MTPSQRVSLLKQIAFRLSEEQWPLVDLTLSQFGLPIQKTWSGTILTYILEMTKNVNEDVLIDLGSQLGLELESSSSHIAPAFWQPGYFRLFLSHLSAESGRASELRAELTSYAISAFVAHRDIAPTKDWQEQIELALHTSDALCALMHPGFHESYWTDQEVGVAMGRRILIVSVRLGQDPYGFIGKFQAMPGTGRTTPILARALFDLLAGNKQTSSRMAEALTTRFENASTYKEAKDAITLIELLPSPGARIHDRLSAALLANDQVGSAYGVPERVKALATRSEQA